VCHVTDVFADRKGQLVSGSWSVGLTSTRNRLRSSVLTSSVVFHRASPAYSAVAEA